jgi:ABC-type uncharacterized transport system substrate-binding protein
MRLMTRRFSLSLHQQLLALLLVGSSPAMAHPHSWIDMTSQLQIDGQKRLIGLHLSWLFDEFYSATILDDAKANGHSVNQELTLFGQDTLTNLATENYLNRMTLNGQKVHFGQGRDVHTRWQEGQIRLDYYLPLEPPVSLAGKRLQFAIYDSTYYVEMLHHQVDAIQLQGDGAKGCQRQLVPPNPTDEQQSYAISLDKTEQADDGLGTAFAEQVIVTCSPLTPTETTP